MCILVCVCTKGSWWHIVCVLYEGDELCTVARLVSHMHTSTRKQYLCHQLAKEITENNARMLSAYEIVHACIWYMLFKIIHACILHIWCLIVLMIRFRGPVYVVMYVCVYVYAEYVDVRQRHAYKQLCLQTRWRICSTKIQYTASWCVYSTCLFTCAHTRARTHTYTGTIHSHILRTRLVTCAQHCTKRMPIYANLSLGVCDMPAQCGTDGSHSEMSASIACRGFWTYAERSVKLSPCREIGICNTNVALHVARAVKHDIRPVRRDVYARYCAASRYVLQCGAVSMQRGLFFFKKAQE